MILIKKNIDDNFTMIRGFVRIFIMLLFLCHQVFALEKIGIITDALLTPVNYYNAYYITPDFFANDIRSQLNKKNINVISIEEMKTFLQNSGVRQQDLEALKSLSQGYNLDYNFLKKIAKSSGVKKIVVTTMGIDIQRDFLKNTLWNVLNISGQDVVNPTHRVSVYCALVDIENQNVLWESIYAKNIRNNKMKNLDTTISNNYEGMLRLKEYSKYISPDIAYNVKMKMLNPNFVEPPTYITKENLVQYAKDKHNMGVKKELSEIDRKKWDDKKLKENTKTNIVNATNTTKKTIKTCFQNAKNAIINTKNKVFNRKKHQQWL